MPSMRRSSNCSILRYGESSSPSAVGLCLPLLTKLGLSGSAAACRDGRRANSARNSLLSADILMWGVRPVARLADIGVLTIGQVAQTPDWSLKRLLGPAAGGHTRRADLRNRDPRRGRGAAGARRARGSPEREDHLALGDLGVAPPGITGISSWNCRST
jgi:hypothetical protein